jgi:hypothetical protein
LNRVFWKLICYFCFFRSFTSQTLVICLGKANNSTFPLYL